MTPSPKPLGVIAGSGRFPVLFAEEARKQSSRVVAVALKGVTDLPTLKDRRTDTILSAVAAAFVAAQGPGMTQRSAAAMLAAGALACFMAAGCGRRAEPPSQGVAPELLRLQTPPKRAKVDPNAPPRLQELQRRLVASENHELDVAMWEGARTDRAELVRPAPAGFKPAAKGKRLGLRLVPARSKIGVGDRFWYRLELQNLGSEPVTVTDPIFKHAVPPGVDSHVDFIVTLPDGKEENAIPPFFGDPDRLPLKDIFETRIPASELPAHRKRQIELSVKSRVEALVLPGETLVSRPEREPRRDAPPAAEGAFRPLISDFSFKLPGHYKVRAVYGDPKPVPPSEFFLKAMAARGVSREESMADYDRHLKGWTPPIESNVAELEVAR